MQKAEMAAKVTGTGVLVSGREFYLVSSQSEDGRSHVVEQLPTRLRCDCKGYAYRGKCAHVAAVVAHKAELQRQMADAQADLAGAHAAMQDAARRYDALAEAHAASRGTAGATPAPAHGAWFAGRSQEPFHFMR